MNLGKIANGLVIAGGLTLAGLSNFFYIVEPGNRAIIFDKLHGIRDEIYKEGVHFRIPIKEEVIMYDIRLQPADFHTQTNTKDLQKVDLTLRILHKPIVQNIPKIHKELNRNYSKKFLNSIGKEELKSVIAQYDADQLLKQREKISSEIKERLINRSREFYMLLDDVSITDLNFSKEFIKSIELKLIAQQEAERQKFVVQLNEERKKADIIRARGKAEAAKLITDSTKKYGNTMIKLKKMEAALFITRNLSKSSNVSFIPKGGNFLFGL